MYSVIRKRDRENKKKDLNPSSNSLSTSTSSSTPSSTSKISQISKDSFFLISFFISVFTFSIHLYASPFTKVEESFPLQGIHDVLFHGWNLEEYDHHEFPGVVPRTFIGSLFVSILCFPFKIFMIDIFQFSKIISLYIVRGMIGLILSTCFSVFVDQIDKVFGRTQSIFFLILSISQFHFFYYLSRPLPNTFALALVLLSYSFLLKSKKEWIGIGLLTFTSVVFRSEIVLLLGPFCLSVLMNGRISFKSLIITGIISGIFALGMTIAIDSIFWGRWIWPEFEVFWFNTYHNKSHLWGTQPYHWYFTSALPRSLNGTYPISIISLFLIIYQKLKLILSKKENEKKNEVKEDKEKEKEEKKKEVIIYFVVPCLVFLFVYSFLPHKELRFIFYVIPVFTLLASFLLSSIYNWVYSENEEKEEINIRNNISKNKIKKKQHQHEQDQEQYKEENVLKIGLPNNNNSKDRKRGDNNQVGRRTKVISKRTLFIIIIGGMIICGIFLSSIILFISSHNYPGAYAFKSIHSLYHEERDRPLKIHIGVEAAMTGVSRFGELNPQWIYSKVEGRKFKASDYDIVITDSDELKGFKVVDKISSFDSLKFRKIPSNLEDLKSFLKILLFKPLSMVQYKTSLYIQESLSFKRSSPIPLR